MERLIGSVQDDGIPGSMHDLYDAEGPGCGVSTDVMTLSLRVAMLVAGGETLHADDSTKQTQA